MFIHYVWWHYTTAIVDLVRNYSNLAAFLRNFFSLTHLTRNLFAPWRRLGEEYPQGGFDLQAFFSTLIVNTLIRAVGFFIRFIFIIVGVLALLLSLFLFGVVLFVWLALPAILIFLVIFSYKLLIA